MDDFMRQLEKSNNPWKEPLNSLEKRLEALETKNSKRYVIVNKEGGYVIGISHLGEILIDNSSYYDDYVFKDEACATALADVLSVVHNYNRFSVKELLRV